MIGLSVAHHMAHPLSRDLLHRPLGNLQDTRQHVTPAYPSHPSHPYTPVSKGVLLDFDHPPPSSVQHPGSGYSPPSRGHYSTSRTPISGHVRFQLPTSPPGEFPTPTHPRVLGNSSQLVSYLHRPPIPSYHAPVVHGHKLSAQDLDC